MKTNKQEYAQVPEKELTGKIKSLTKELEEIQTKIDPGGYLDLPRSSDAQKELDNIIKEINKYISKAFKLYNKRVESKNNLNETSNLYKIIKKAMENVEIVVKLYRPDKKYIRMLRLGIKKDNLLYICIL